MTSAGKANDPSPSCPLCNSRKLKVRIRTPRSTSEPGRSWQVLECLRCSFRFTHPRPSPEEVASLYPPSYGPYQRGDLTGAGIFNPGLSAFDRFKNRLKWSVLTQEYGYPGISLPASSTAFDSRAETIGRWLAPIFRPYIRHLYPRLPYGRGGGKALDVGCGNGVYLLLLKGLGWEVAGFDRENHTVPEVEAAGIPVHTGSLEELASRRHGSFELITMWHVLEHLENPRATLGWIRRLLAPEGLLMLEVPNCRSLAAKIFGRHWIGYDLPRHLSHFSVTTARRILDEAGFTVVRQACSWKQHLAANIAGMLQQPRGTRATGRRLPHAVACRAFNAVGHLLALAGAGESIHLTARKKKPQ